MTITTHFQLGAERVIVRIIGENVLFIDPQNNMMAPLEGLSLNKQGVEKEHPDLVGDPEWKQKAIQRFVDKIKSLPSETARTDWIIDELKQMGYTPLFKQRDGFRPQKIK